MLFCITLNFLMRYLVVWLLLIYFLGNVGLRTVLATRFVLPNTILEGYINQFNAEDVELYEQFIGNKNSASFLSDSIPFFECPDKAIERTYYFRWWTFRKHIKLVKGMRSFFVFTEFLAPVGWSGLHNTISCAAAHHFMEGRWLRNQTFLDDYARFWMREGAPRQYSFWIAHALRMRAAVTGDDSLSKQLFPQLLDNFNAIRKTNLEDKIHGRMGLYFNTDNRDGMEKSIGGSGKYGDRGYRPTLNSYQFGEAWSLAKVAAALKLPDIAQSLAYIAADLKQKVEQTLWDPADSFFKVLPYKNKTSSLVSVRELVGYTPWYFNLPSSDKLVAWRQLIDETGGFNARYGLTTAEQRNPQFELDYDSNHECLWNGPVWPYATAMTLTAFANAFNMHGDGSLLLQHVSRDAFLTLLHTYAVSHTIYSEKENKNISWIDENLNPYTGDWISRTILKRWEKAGKLKAEKGGSDRGKDYNHSTFVDLILSALLGIRGRPTDVLVINPLLAADAWAYFCVDGLRYHNRDVTIVWDRHGTKYQRGAGLTVLVNGRVAVAGLPLQKVKIDLAGY